MSILSTTDRAVTSIYADELTEGDIIRNFNGEVWIVATEPEYTDRGIEFEVLLVTARKKERGIQQVCFHPSWRFELVDSNKAAALAVA